MLKIERPWRNILARTQAPDLVFADDIDFLADLGLQPEDEAVGFESEPDHDEYQATTTNKNLPETFVLNDPSGGDFKEGSPNYTEAFSIEYLRKKRIINTFAVIISKVAEDLSGWPIPGDDEWDVPALMERRLTRRTLNQCRRSREKEAVVVILDTSGSCLPQAVFYNQIAYAAVQASDIELYAAPNAGIQARRTRNGWIPVDDREWPFVNRTIIFFGDYDGGNHVVESSWRNKVYWFCSEGNRYPSMSLHPWCSYPLSYFKGGYYDCVNEDDFLKLLRKVR